MGPGCCVWCLVVLPLLCLTGAWCTVAAWLIRRRGGLQGAEQMPPGRLSILPQPRAEASHTRGTRGSICCLRHPCGKLLSMRDRTSTVLALQGPSRQEQGWRSRSENRDTLEGHGPEFQPWLLRCTCCTRTGSLVALGLSFLIRRMEITAKILTGFSSASNETSDAQCPPRSRHCMQP